MMQRRRSTRLAALCGTLWALSPGAALAADGACRAINIESNEALRERWPELVPGVRDDLLARDDLDACAQVTLSLRRNSEIGITVALPDGRSASRTALRREDVIPTLQALLLVPKRALAEVPTRTHPVAPAPRRGPRRTRATAARMAAEGQSAFSAMSADPATGLGVELSLVAGARIGDGQTSFGLGALSFLDFSGWLVGFEGRADQYHPLSDGAPDAALELGALLGKRIRFPSVTLDLAAGPGVAIKGMVSDTQVVSSNNGDNSGSMPPPAPPAHPPEPSSGPVPRLLVGARLGFNPGSVLRTFVGVEGAFGPARAEGNSNEGSPRLPRWTLGLALGATVGTR